eukprot:759651-Hanusia_phi.AAC.1
MQVSRRKKPTHSSTIHEGQSNCGVRMQQQQESCGALRRRLPNQPHGEAGPRVRVHIPVIMIRVSDARTPAGQEPRVPGESEPGYHRPAEARRARGLI